LYFPIYAREKGDRCQLLVLEFLRLLSNDRQELLVQKAFIFARYEVLSRGDSLALRLSPVARISREALASN
jgi:hypothetical protein